MEIPSREFFRYLVLCGYDLAQILEAYDRYRFVKPRFPEAYYMRQVEWAYQLLGAVETTVPAALRRARMVDMWCAFRAQRPGQKAAKAFHLANHDEFKKPIEAFLIAGYMDHEVAGALTHSINLQYKVEPEDIVAYRRYFFDPSILSLNDRLILARETPHVRLGMLALEPDILEHLMGLRYKHTRDMYQRAHDLGLQKWLNQLELIELRSDSESLKALSSFFAALKTFDASTAEKLKKKSGDMPLVELLRQQSTPLEVGV